MTSAAQPKQIDEVKYLQAIQSDTHTLANKLKDSDDAEAIFYGLQLAECVADENLFVGFGMTNKDGEVFTGRGNLVGTSSRLDRFYLQKQARLGRKDIARYLSKVKLQPSEKWRFLTLTMPKLKGYRFALVMKVYDDAFKILRDSAYWKKKIRAGTKSKEFTLGNEWKAEVRPWTLVEDGFHIHAHLIVAAKWLENRKVNETTGEKYYRELAENWKKALVKSANKNRVILEFNTDDGLPIVDVRLIKDKATNSSEISLTDAIAETAKYITKPTSMEHLPIEQIMEITNYLRGKRMIEPLGEANKRKGKVKPKGAVVETDSDSLDHASISFSEHADANDTSVLEKRTIESCARLKRECLTLIERGDAAAAAALVKRTFEKRRAFRRRHLTLLYPDAEFMTLDGEVFSSEDYEMCNFREETATSDNGNPPL
jgi:hypothetical protein